MSDQQTQPEAHGHYMRKVDGVWRCASCSETRDKYGRPMKPRHLKVVKQ